MSSPVFIPSYRAKKEFALCERDLQSLPCSICFPRQDQRPLRLYDSKDVFQKAMEKWGTRDGLLSELHTRRAQAEDDKNARRLELEHALQEKGLMLRPDSRLCRAYIIHGQGDPHEIATTMEEMDFFFRQTKYQTIRQQLYKKEWEDIRRDPSWLPPPDPYAISSKAKELALQSFTSEHGTDDERIPQSLRQ